MDIRTAKKLLIHITVQLVGRVIIPQRYEVMLKVIAIRFTLSSSKVTHLGSLFILISDPQASPLQGWFHLHCIGHVGRTP